jgi:DNA modification methylase
MNDYSDAEGIIVDLFLGSGSALIAAEQLGRTCYGMEIDPVYCDVICKRWKEFTGKQPILQQK